MELAHLIMEAKKSHETQESCRYMFHLSPKASEDQSPSSAVRKSLIFLFPCLFVLSRPQ